ncbi:MAG: hypothetical protein FWF04_03325 [Clostridiales bacterium]|nr:hypothetical protein [Clostridiales bacterium]
MIKELKFLFLANAIFNGIGAIVLFLGTGILNNMTGLSSEASFVWNLLGACSLSLAFLSFFATKFQEKIAIWAVATVFMIFHLISAVVSVIVVANGTNQAIIGNTIVHLLFFILFVVFGIKFIKPYNASNKA